MFIILLMAVNTVCLCLPVFFTYMTRLARRNRMETDKGKFCKVVIKKDLLSPSL